MSGDDPATGTRPIDLASYYLTSRLGVGEALNVSSIRQCLSLYPVEAVLECLSEIAIRADRLPIGDPDQSVSFARWLFPRRYLARVERALADPNAAPTSSYIAVNLALHALVVCAPEGEPPPKDELIQTLGALCLALGSHLGRDGLDQDSLTLEITRLGLYFTLNDLSSWMELAHELLFEVMPSMTEDHDFVDADAVIRDSYGMGLERFWSLTVVEGIAVKERPAAAPIPQRVEGWNVTEDELELWVNAWSDTVDGARSAAERDLSRSTGWSFEAFVDRPLIRLADGSKSVAVRPAWIPSKATPSGMFWAVRHPLVAAGGSHQTWSQFMGRAVEELGRRLLARYLPEVEAFDESDIATWGPGSNCDAILVDGGVVAIDFVFRQFTKETSGTGNFADLAKDLRKAAVQKLSQIDTSLAKGLAGGHLPATSLYPVVVIGGPFPVNPLLYEAVSSALAKEGTVVIGEHADAKPFALVDMSSFLALLGAAKALQTPVIALLDAWLSSSMGQASFRDWLTTDGPQLPEETFDFGWRNRAFSNLGLPEPPGNT